jgi:peptide-methionine (S)-S-oxide reductase
MKTTTTHSKNTFPKDNCKFCGEFVNLDDEGTQYRSIIIAENAAQREAAEKAKAGAQPRFRGGIVTEIIEGTEFFPAEKYHQDFAERNPGHPYVRAVIDPKLIKIRNK